jgi:hypothetical protein
MVLSEARYLAAGDFCNSHAIPTPSRAPRSGAGCCQRRRGRRCRAGADADADHGAARSSPAATRPAPARRDPATVPRGVVPGRARLSRRPLPHAALRAWLRQVRGLVRFRTWTIRHRLSEPLPHAAIRRRFPCASAADSGRRARCWRGSARGRAITGDAFTYSTAPLRPSFPANRSRALRSGAGSGPRVRYWSEQLGLG